MYTFLVLGDAKAGKTTLIKRFRGEVSEKLFRLIPYSKTTSVTEYKKKVNDREINIIDTPGSHAAVSDWNKAEMETVDCVLFVFDVSDSRSLANLWFWYQVFEEAMGLNASQVRRLVIATKCDFENVIEDSIMNQVNSFKDSIKATFLSTSANKDANVKETFEIPKEIKLDESPAQEEQSLVHKNVLTLSISSTPSEVETTDHIIEDIAFSPDGMTMTSSEYILKWDFLSQPKFGKMALEFSDEDAPKRLRNPSYPFFATKSDDEEETPWIFERIIDRDSRGVEAHFQPEMLRTKCIKDIGICTRCLHCREDEDRPFVFTELFANGQLNEKAGILGNKAEITNKHDIKSLDISPSHITAITSKGKLLCKNSILQCQKASSPMSLELSDDLRVDQVACGLQFTVILTAQQEVFAWGDNSYGQLGLGDTDKRPNLVSSCKLTKVTKAKNEKVLAISAGFYHAAALTDKGRLREWGLGVKLGKNQSEGFLTLPKCSRGKKGNVTSMCCGAFHTLCVEEYKTLYRPSVFARGKGDQGQLGTGEVEDSENEATFIGGQLYKLNTVKQVAAGYEHSAFLTSSGEVYTCGNNRFGQLGYLTSDEKNPDVRKVEFGEEFRIEKIMCREDCTVAVGQKGEIFMWGAASYHGAVNSSFSELSHGDELQKIEEMVHCSIEYGDSVIEMTLALTETKQIAVLEIRDTNDVISLEKSPCLISTNLNAPRNLCYVGGYLIALDENEKFFCCDLKTHMVLQTQNSQKQDSVSEKVATKEKPDKEDPDTFSAKTFALKLRNKQFEIEFESVETPCRFKEICATRKKLFLLSELGDVFRLDLPKTKKKSQAKITVFNAPLLAMLQERNKKVMPEKNQAVNFVFHEHIELAHKVATQLVCGPNHAAVLTQDGGIYVFHKNCKGKSDLLRFEQFKIKAHQMESNNIKKITCGEEYTAALTERGRVFIWKNPSKAPLSRWKGTKENVDAKIHRETAVGSMNPEAVQCSCNFDFSDIRRSPEGIPVALDKKAYKIKVKQCSKDAHLDSKPKVLVSNTDGSGKPTKVNFCNVNENVLEGWFSFPKAGTFTISCSFLGQPIPKSQLCCHVSASVEVKTCKLMLLGPYSQNLNRNLKTRNGALMRNNGDFKYEVWAMDQSSEEQMSTESFLSQDLLSMLCVTDRAVYLYALDVNTFTLYSLEHLKVWLQYLNYKAPSSKVVVVEINEFEDLSVLNLQELRKINPNVKDANVIDNVTPEKILEIVDQCVESDPPSKRILKGVIDLETKIIECRLEKHYLTEKEFSQIATECGLKIYWQITEAAQYLQEVGIALFFGFANFYLLLDWSDEWFASFVKLIKNKSPKGILHFNRNDVDVEIRNVINVLVKSGIAFHSHSEQSSAVYIPHLFVPLPDSVWPKLSQLSASRIAVIHLVYDKDPLKLYVTFPELCKKIDRIRREDDDVCFGRFSMVFRIPEDQNIEAKIECGPHNTYKGQTVIRLTVRALHTETVSSLTLVEHLLSLTDQLRQLEPTEDVKMQCSKCKGPSFGLNAAQSKVTIAGEDANLKCPYCKEIVLISNLLQGADEKKPLPPLWKPIISKQQSCQEVLLREIIKRQKHHEKKSEERHLKIEKMLNQQHSEMREMLTQLRKFMIDLDESDTPTLVQILPNTFSPLPKKWKSFKLYLWCEGDSSLMKPHPLNENDHKGYSLPNKIMVKIAKYLRPLLPVLSFLPLLVTFIPAIGQIASPFLTFLAMYFSIKFPRDLRRWHETMNKLDAYLAQMEGKNKVVSTLPENETTLKLTKAEYRHLKEFLKEADNESSDPKAYGGLERKEVGGRVIWVCRLCREHMKDT